MLRSQPMPAGVRQRGRTERTEGEGALKKAVPSAAMPYRLLGLALMLFAGVLLLLGRG